MTQVSNQQLYALAVVGEFSTGDSHLSGQVPKQPLGVRQTSCDVGFLSWL